MRDRSINILMAAAFLFGAPLPAQTGNTPFGLGYTLPVVSAAPGSLINLFVQGVGGTLTAPVTATSFPLPTTLAGISVTFSQLVQPGPIAVPVLSVRPMSACASPLPPLAGIATACAAYAEITIQAPLEMHQTVDGPNRMWFVVSENGVAGGAIEIYPSLDQVHVLSVTHSDWTPVDQRHPAGGGEVLVMWALGLGITTPRVPTGQVTPLPAPVTTEKFRVDYNYLPNAPPSSANVPTQSAPLFAGLSPGYAGLYQVAFAVPPPPAGTPACNTIVATNLTVSIVGVVSFDGAGICVDVSGASNAAAEPALVRQHAR